MTHDQEFAIATTTVPLYHSIRKEDFTGGVIVDDHAVAGVLL
jgi:hypothetical protein